MSKSKPPTLRDVLRKAPFFLAFMLLGAGVGVAAAHWKLFETGHLALTGGEMAALALLALLLLPLLVLWHELGHMAGGRLVGFRPVLLVVGPVRWQREGGRWRVRANRSAALAGGLAVCVPQGMHALVRRTAGLIAGGPLASLAGGVAGLAAWAALPPLGAGSPFAAVAGTLALAVFGFGNLFLAAVSLAPTRTGGFYSDGARLLRMARGGPEMDREVAILLLTGMTLGGARPRDWDPALVARALGEADRSPFRLMGVQFAFAHAQDRGERERARELARLLLDGQETLPPILRSALRLSTVYFTAVHERDAERATALVRESEGGILIDRHIRHLARAAAAWAAGDADVAAAELERAEAELPRAVDRGAATVAAERVAELRGLLREVPSRGAALA